MIEIRYLQAESGANKFGTCNCCGKSSSEDPLMISVKFSYYGHGTLICLCDDCKKKLTEALPPANCSEFPNNSDTISRANAIEALTKDKKALEHIINGMSGYEKEFDRFVGQRNQVDSDIYAIKQLPSAQPERIKGHWIESNGLNILMKKFIEKGETWRLCDKCGVGFMIGYQYECDKLYHETFHNFCPKCGADMRGEQK